MFDVYFIFISVPFCVTNVYALLFQEQMWNGQGGMSTGKEHHS